MSVSARQKIMTHADAQAEHWVVKLASGELEAAELAAFKAWLATDPAHRIAFDRERMLWQSLDQLRGAFEPAPRPRRSRLRGMMRLVTQRRALAAAAAAAFLLVLSPDAALWLQADAIAGRGEIRTVTLPDGSQAVLDSEAAIAVAYSNSERRVRLLRGQAWFTVKHGDPRAFRVAALGGMTEDIGTAFEVNRSSSAVTVSVTEGAVRVSSPITTAGPVLQASERAHYPKGGTVKRIAAMDRSQIAAWRRGIIVIDNRPVAEAIADVARYRQGYTWVIDAHQNAPVSGIFRTDDPDEALAMLTQMAGLKAMRLPGGVAIVRR